MIKLEEITKENFHKVISLKVADDSKLSSNLFFIAQLKIYPEWISSAIYYNDIVVGLMIYEIDHTYKQYIIRILMIDEKYQRNGYGTKAMEAIIKIFKQRKEYKNIILSVFNTDTGTIDFYKKLGFEFNGEVYDEFDEGIMELKIF